MTDSPSFDTIKLAVADNVATITLNRPDRLNSMPPAMVKSPDSAKLHPTPAAGPLTATTTGMSRLASESSIGL